MKRNTFAYLSFYPVEEIISGKNAAAWHSVRKSSVPGGIRWSRCTQHLLISVDSKISEGNCHILGIR